MKIEELVGTALGVAAGICIVAFAVINSKKVELSSSRSRRSRSLSISSFSLVSVGSEYTNFDNTIRVEVKKVYSYCYKENIILYSKFNAKTGRYIETCSMPEGRFLSIYY